MGAQLVLDIVPRRIEPADWAEAYDEARSLLLAHPSRLLGYDWTTVAGVPLPVYTRAVERDRDDPTARRWCVAGERTTLATGEPQTMYRDLGRYLAPASTPQEGPCPALDDVLFAAAAAAVAVDGAPESLGRALPAHPVPVSGHAFFSTHATHSAHATHSPHASRGVARPGGGLARVLAGGSAGAPCGLPLLAAAMVVEARFPRWAMVHGDVEREQAEAARRWAEGVLGRPVALPVRVDAWRLVERLGARFEGQALVSAVDRLYLGAAGKKDATLLGIFGRAEAEPWWLGKLREHDHPDRPGALQLLAAYLEATRDLGRMCGLACLDARGPRYAPEALIEALASLRARGVGRLDDAAVEQALTGVCGAGAARLAETLKRREAAQGSPAAPVGGAARGVDAELEGLATLPSPGDLTPLQREHVHALAFLVGARRHEGGAPSPEGALQALATSLARSGPMLTEDAWDWIAREEDAELVRFLAALAALDDAGAELAAARRALFENRGLCRYALGAHGDEALMAAVAARIQAPRR